jgi:hypothetical protein
MRLCFSSSISLSVFHRRPSLSVFHRRPSVFLNLMSQEEAWSAKFWDIKNYLVANFAMKDLKANLEENGCVLLYPLLPMITFFSRSTIAHALVLSRPASRTHWRRVWQKEWCLGVHTVRRARRRTSASWLTLIVCCLLLLLLLLLLSLL